MSRWRLLAVGFLLAGGVLAGLYLARGRLLPPAARWLDVGQRPQKADYVMVLGGDVNSRPFAAAALVKSGVARKVLVSHVEPSPAVEDSILPPEHELSRRVLLEHAIPAADIALVGKDNGTTYDEALALAGFLRLVPDARVIVVTNGYHARRARWVFRQVLGDRADHVSVFSAPTDDFATDAWWHTERGFKDVLGENLKLLFYILWYSRVGYGVAACAAALLVLLWACCRGRRKKVGSPTGAPK